MPIVDVPEGSWPATLERFHQTLWDIQHQQIWYSKSGTSIGFATFLRMVTCIWIIHESFPLKTACLLLWAAAPPNFYFIPKNLTPWLCQYATSCCSDCRMTSSLDCIERFVNPFKGQQHVPGLTSVQHYPQPFLPVHFTTPCLEQPHCTYFFVKNANNMCSLPWHIHSFYTKESERNKTLVIDQLLARWYLMHKQAIVVDANKIENTTGQDATSRFRTTADWFQALVNTSRCVKSTLKHRWNKPFKVGCHFNTKLSTKE